MLSQTSWHATTSGMSWAKDRVKQSGPVPNRSADDGGLREKCEGECRFVSPLCGRSCDDSLALCCFSDRYKAVEWRLGVGGPSIVARPNVGTRGFSLSADAETTVVNVAPRGLLPFHRVVAAATDTGKRRTDGSGARAAFLPSEKGELGVCGGIVLSTDCVIPCDRFVCEPRSFEIDSARHSGNTRVGKEGVAGPSPKHRETDGGAGNGGSRQGLASDTSPLFFFFLRKRFLS
ncbi:hypothetical protein MRX96_042284 [Rhipicephalus microplus]